MILVTGAAGLVGYPVAVRLAAGGRDLVATDAQAPALALAAPFVVADLRSPGALAEIIARYKVTTVIHCGAISGRMVAPNEPYRVASVNVTGTIHLAEAARLAKVERFIALSSIGVYCHQATLDPVTEEAPLPGHDIYSASKVAMEAVLRGYRHDFGLPVTVLRASSIFGPGRRTPCFIRAMLEAGLEGRVAAVSDAGDCRRQFLYIDDAVDAVFLALDATVPLDFAYNVTGGTWLTESEVAAIALRAVPTLKVAVGPVPPLCLDGRMGPLAIGKIAGALGYQPKVSLEEGIRRYWTYLTERQGR